MSISQRLALVVVASCLLACGGGDSPKDGGTGSPPPVAWKAAVGASGTFVQTFDDAAWSTRTLGDASFFGVACVGNLDGWAVGARGTIAHTVDGGRTWSFQTSGTTNDLRGVRFADAMRGLAVGDGGALLTTSDAGDRWQSARVSELDLRSAAVAPSLGVWLAVGAGGRVLRSVDGGASWSVFVVDGASNLRGVASDAEGKTVLAVDDLGAIFASADAGEHFTRETRVGVPLDAVSIDDAGGPAIAVGARGVVATRDPSTHEWTVTPVAAAVDLHAALVTSEGTRFYVAGDDGALFTRTTDEPSWARVALDTHAALFGLEDL